MGNEEMNSPAIEKVVLFEREELHRIESKARKQAGITPNPHWQRALEDLAYAANVLDAHIGRSSVGVPVSESAQD